MRGGAKGLIKELKDFCLECDGYKLETNKDTWQIGQKFKSYGHKVKNNKNMGANCKLKRDRVVVEIVRKNNLGDVAPYNNKKK